MVVQSCFSARGQKRNAVFLSLVRTIGEFVINLFLTVMTTHQQTQQLLSLISERWGINASVKNPDKAEGLQRIVMRAAYREFSLLPRVLQADHE